MVAVAGPSLRQLERISTDFETQVVRELRRIAALVIDKLDLTRLEEALDDLALLRQEWEATLDATVLPTLASIYEEGTNAVAEPASEDALTAAATFRVPCVTSEVAEAYLAMRRNPLAGVADRTWSVVRDELIIGMHEGEGVETLRLRLQKAAKLGEGRAGVIARTEANGAANAGAIEQVRSTGEAALKRWAAVGGPRTRPHHAAANGQVRALDEPFVVGGHALDRPHDPSAPASEVVNCRCTVTFELDKITPEFLPSLVRGQPAGLVAGIGNVVGCVLKLVDESAYMRECPWMAVLDDLTGGSILYDYDDAVQLQEQLAGTYDTPLYRRWSEEATGWGYIDSAQNIRRSVERRLGGETDLSGEMWLNALAEAPLTRHDVYRGMGWEEGRMTEDRLRRMFPFGSEVDLPLSSFSAEHEVAAEFSGETSGYYGTQLIITLQRHARAIPVGYWADEEGLFEQLEVVTGGRFRVVGALKHAGADTYTVTLKQVGVYRP